MKKFYNLLKKLSLSLLIFAIVLTASQSVTRFLRKPPQPSGLEDNPQPEIVPDFEDNLPAPEPEVNLHEMVYPIGEFCFDNKREGYQSGEMLLKVPKLDLETPVLSIPLADSLNYAERNGLSDYDTNVLLLDQMQTTLDSGVVLFNESALPGLGNRNVSIAGHRDYRNMEFYYINTLGPGDRIYLIYEDHEYIYEYEDTIITDDMDWTPIQAKGFNVITLQSCDPILPANGVYDRIFVTGRLVQIVPLHNFSTYDASVCRTH